MNHVAVVGATGLVGLSFLELMQDKKIIPHKLSLFASEKSKGGSLQFAGKKYPVQTLEKTCFEGVDIAFFSAGGSVSKAWARQAVREGAKVIDNSSAFRMDSAVPLVIPEVNAHHLKDQSLIANPNCSAIQLCLVLHSLHLAFELESVQVATYQSMSGAGAGALEKLKSETLSYLQGGASSFAFNCTPQIGDIKENGLSAEETKMREETKKILDCSQLDITVLTVRVPTLFSHGEVLWVYLKKAPKSRNHFLEVLQKQKGLTVMKGYGEYPDNFSTTGKDDVFVGRIHQAPNNPHRWLMWISADNIRKGAALNGLQIAQLLMDKA